MFIYFFLFLIIMLIYFFFGKYYVKRRDYLINPNIHKKVKKNVIFIGLFIFILSAFRDISVGIDTESYLWTYERLPKIMPKLSFRFLNEDGYMLIEYFCMNYFLGFRGVLIIGAILFIFPTTYIIYKYSENPYLSFFYFISLDYFCFSMSGMRQSMALGICLIALEMVFRRKFIMYLLLICIAVTIHSTAIVFLPVYFLGKIPTQRKYFKYFLCVGILGFIFKNNIGELLRSMSRVYYGEISTGGVGMYIYMCSIVIIGIIYMTDTKEKYRKDTIIDFMVMVAIIIYPILKFNPTVFRLHYYYSILIIIYIPKVLQRIDNIKIKFLFQTFLFLVAIYYFIEYTMQSMGANPYVFGIGEIL